MVCKEEFFQWFKSLKGSKRLEVLCGLLNMCYPLELRYCATCVEELASRDFNIFKEEESKANNPSEISKVRNILDPQTRHKLIVFLSLLHSSNVLCSNSMFKALVEELKIEGLISAGIFSDSKCVDEILLLITLAQNHPAFTFEQQMYLMELLYAVESCVQQTSEEASGRSSLNNLMPVNLLSPVLIQDSHLCSNSSVCYHGQCDVHGGQKNVNQAVITSLKVKSPHKRMSFRMRVSFGTNKMFDIFKTPYEIAVFHQKLTQLYSHESQPSNREKTIPQLSHIVTACSKQEILNEAIAASLTEYIEQLNSHLTSRVMQSDFVVNFFLPSGHGRSSLSKSVRRNESYPPDDAGKNPYLPSLTIYNSHISPTKHLDDRPRMASQSSSGQLHSRKGTENGATTTTVTDTAVVPQNSMPISPPYVSPPNSETNSRSASPWVPRATNDQSSGIPSVESYMLEKLLSKENLNDYWDILRHFRIDQLQAKSSEELECIGMTKEASSKLRKALDNFRSFGPPNGLSSQLTSRYAVPPAPSNCLPIQDVSNESSPLCSEYSSPAESPSPTEICNHNSPNSSSSEETSVEKGVPFNDHKLSETTDRNPQITTKRLNENLVFSKSSRDGIGRHSVTSVVPFPVGYAATVTQLSPMQTHKPSFLPMECRTNAGLHLGPSGVFINNQFSRVPLPSALTFLPHMTTQRSHSGTPERGLTSASGLPITTLCPFPVVTSGCNTVPSATCSFASNRSGNITVVTNSVAPGNGCHNRQMHKVIQPPLDSEILPKPLLHQQTVESMYAPNFLLSSSDVFARTNGASTCSCTATFPRPSPSPSPSLPPATTPQPTAVPVTLPYIGLQYMLPNSFPFLPTHTGASANGFMQSATLPNPGHGFTYALPNGMSAIAPEMLYGAHAFSPQTPSPSQATPPLIASPVSHCLGSYLQPITVAGMAATHAVKVATCYNCGKMGHRGSECKDQNIEEISKPGKFQMNFVLAAKSLDSND